MTEHKKTYYKTLAENIINKFEKRGIEGYFCSDKSEVIDCIDSILQSGSSVAWGGSETLKEIGLFEYLNKGDLKVFDRALAQTKEEKKEMYANIFTCDYFFMSSNAVTVKGELVNIDGLANRVAPMCYGPENVIIIAGMNKVVPDVESGIKRVRNMATPPNAVRLNKDTPCHKTGQCSDCLVDDCMCCQIVVTRKSNIKNRIKVILVGEELGY